MTIRRIDHENRIIIPARMLAEVGADPDGDYVFFEPNDGSLGHETSWVDQERGLEIGWQVMARNSFKPGHLVELTVQPREWGPTIIARPTQRQPRLGREKSRKARNA